MFESDIIEHCTDGADHTLRDIATAVGCVPFLIQQSVQELVLSGRLSCRDVLGERLYSRRTLKSRLPELDLKVDKMAESVLPGFQPQDPTAIIKPQEVLDVPFDIDKLPDLEIWHKSLPEGLKDAAPWFIEGMGWEYDPFEHPVDTTGISPCDSPIRWMGGKSKMLPWLIQRFPDHYAYVEVFGGSLKPFFGKRPSQVEIVNDYYESLINFWRIAHSWPGELADAVNAIPASRVYQRWFQRAAAGRNHFERAVMFGYLSLHSYNGMIWKPFAGSPHQKNGKLDPVLLTKASQRLQGVTIESLDFRKLIERYSLKSVAAGAVFTYMDPPYMKTEGYALKFPDAWHEELAHYMVKIHEAGNLVLMTNSKVAGPAYMRWFGNARQHFHVEYVDVNYTVGHAESRGDRKEAVISNFKLVGKQGGLFG